MKPTTIAIVTLASIGAVSGGWYFGSPYWTMYQMKEAATANDTDRLATYIDFPALRDSFKREAQAEMASGLLSGDSDPMEAMGAALGTAITDRLIDAAVTPEMMRKALSGQGAGTKLSNLSLDDFELVRDSFSQFRLRRDNGAALVFERRGLGWQLVAIRTPPNGSQPTNADTAAAAASPSPITPENGADTSEVAQSAPDEGADPANEPQYSAAYANCMASGDAAAGVTSAMMDCIGAEIAGQDAKLNATYRRLMATLEATEAKALRERQRNWIKLRDATCKEAAADEEGGTLAGVILNQCILKETATRVRFLEAYQR